MKILPAGAVLFNAGGQTGRQRDRHDEANSSFRNYVNALKKYSK